jgi:hypothetical protein
MSAMARKLMLILAFLALFGQVMAGATSTAVPGSGIEHALAHAQDDAHHHHDDGGMHIDDAESGAFHVHLDGANAAALPARVGLTPTAAVPQAPPSMEAGAMPTPPVDGLLRPPKNAS